MNEENFKKELLEFIQYFKDLERDDELDSSVQKNAQRAVTLLEAYPSKIDSHAFGKEEAINLNGDLSKGIGDWAWPPAQEAKIQNYTDKLIAFYGSLF